MQLHEHTHRLFPHALLICALSKFVWKKFYDSVLNNWSFSLQLAVSGTSVTEWTIVGVKPTLCRSKTNQVVKLAFFYVFSEQKVHKR